MEGIYLDHAATTPLRPDVLESMMPYLTEHFGNPSSLHGFGRKAKQALTDARDYIASVLGCSSGQLFFTSGGTESDNMAIIGVAEALKAQGKTHVITTTAEHHAVLQACRNLASRGFQITYMPVDQTGQVNPEDIANAISDKTALVSIMYANNEVGTIQPIAEIGAICRNNDVIFHVDAVQALGAIPIRLSDLPVDLMSFSAHKIGGPKGVGLLYCERHVPLDPILHGGSQERKKRPGTENVAAIVGFAKAIDIAQGHAPNKQSSMRRLRDLFLETMRSEIGQSGFSVNGHPKHRIESIVNISFPGINKETMLMNLDLAGIAASGGSACTSGSLEDSHVLMAMGVPMTIIASSIRFSFGDRTTDQDIIQAAQKNGNHHKPPT